MKVPTRERFLKDVAAHKMTILKDDGVFRHIEFSNPASGNLAFALTTWPGYLAISGDAGDFTFSRVHDMFRFFREDAGTPETDKPTINESYWAQKCVAIDRSSGMTEYDSDLFKEKIEEWYADYVDENGVDVGLRGRLNDEILWYADDGEHAAISAAMDFEHDGYRPFEEIYDGRLTRPTYRFIWCLLAISWGVSRYDRLMAGLENL